MLLSFFKISFEGCVSSVKSTGFCPACLSTCPTCVMVRTSSSSSSPFSSPHLLFFRRANSGLFCYWYPIFIPHCIFVSFPLSLLSSFNSSTGLPILSVACLSWTILIRLISSPSCTLSFSVVLYPLHLWLYSLSFLEKKNF